MLPEEKPPVLPVPEEKPSMLPEGERPSNAPIPLSLALPETREELAAKFEQLAARARAAGISPLQALLKTYAQRGMAVLEGLLSSLESADTEKKV